MNKLTIIGRLVRDPEQRMTQSGISLTTFSVAVDRRRTQQDGQPEADFFRVTAWRQLGENCAKYLAKGRKVCVIGPVSVSTYKAQDGSTRASLEVTADDVEFLSPKGEDAGTPSGPSGATSPRVGGQDAEARYQAQERDAIRREGNGEFVYQHGDDMDDSLPF